MSTDYRRLLLDMFQAAVNAAAPELCVPAHWNGPLEGLVVTRYGHGIPCKHVEVVEASHPVPDEAGSKAARRILDKVSDVTADDLSVIASGPTVPDISTRADALAVLAKYGIEIPANVARHLNDEIS